MSHKQTCIEMCDITTYVTPTKTSPSATFQFNEEYLSWWPLDHWFVQLYLAAEPTRVGRRILQEQVIPWRTAIPEDEALLEGPGHARLRSVLRSSIWGRPHRCAQRHHGAVIAPNRRSFGGGRRLHGKAHWRRGKRGIAPSNQVVSTADAWTPLMYDQVGPPTESTDGPAH